MATDQQTVRIATRTSRLALWQAETVKALLERSGHACELVLIESTGDMHLTQPIYAMGISGVFTKQLDIALLDGTADIAVHSLKDVPTQMAQGLTLTATLERGAYQDIAIIKDKKILNPDHGPAVIATSSLRRRAQWLAKYPAHTTAPIRGNVQTRLRKFEENKDVSGVIFAKAGLERLDLLPSYAAAKAPFGGLGAAIVLDWMIPAPAQGIVGIVCRDNDEATKQKCAEINNQDAFIAGYIERQFLRTLLGGCSVPISALAVTDGDKIKFIGAIHSFDGKRYFIGFSVPHFIPYSLDSKWKLQSSAAIAHQYKQYLLTAGYVFGRDASIVKFRPSFLMTSQTGLVSNIPDFDFNAGLLFIDRIWLIGGVTTGSEANSILNPDQSLKKFNLEGVIIMVQAKITPQLSVGYGYHYSISPLKAYETGTHEIMVGYQFWYDKKRFVTPRYVKYF